MKTTTISILLLFSVFSTASCFFDWYLVDSDGEPLLPGAEYYIVSAIRGPGGGGLDLGSPADLSCPKFVIQHPHELDLGRPATFWPVDTNASYIPVSTDFRIVFVPGLDPLCRAATQWKLDDYDASTGKWWITTGSTGVEPGPNTLNSWFTVTRGTFNRAYKLLFCPRVCDYCVTLCKGINRIPRDGHMGLALDEQVGWQFVFMKASKAKV